MDVFGIGKLVFAFVFIMFCMLEYLVNLFSSTNCSMIVIVLLEMLNFDMQRLAAPVLELPSQWKVTATLKTAYWFR